MSKGADQVFFFRKTRVARWKSDLGFGWQEQGDGSVMVGLGRVGHFRISRGDHRIQLGQPFYKKG